MIETIQERKQLDDEDTYLDFNMVQYLHNQAEVQRIIEKKKHTPLIGRQFIPQDRTESNSQQKPIRKQQSPAEEERHARSEPKPPARSPKKEKQQQLQALKQEHSPALRVKQTSKSILIYGSMFELMAGKVEELSAHFLVVPFTQKNLQIYPGEYVARNQKQISIVNSVKNRILADKNRIPNDQNRPQGESSNFFGLKSSNPNYKCYTFTKIRNKEDILNHIERIINMMERQGQNSIIIPYLNWENIANDQISELIIRKFYQQLTRRKRFRHPVRLTLLAETKSKYLSMDKVFRRIIEEDLENKQISLSQD